LTQDTEAELFSASIPSAKARGLAVPNDDTSNLIFAASIPTAKERGLDGGQGVPPVTLEGSAGRRLFQEMTYTSFTASSIAPAQGPPPTPDNTGRAALFGRNRVLGRGRDFGFGLEIGLHIDGLIELFFGRPHIGEAADAEALRKRES